MISFDQRELDLWINKEQLPAFENFLFELELSQKHVIHVRLVSKPNEIYQTYETTVVEYGSRMFYAFRTKVD